MTPAGWYDDPMTPGGKRYFDGSQWTDHVQAPPVAAQAGPGLNPGSGSPPPFSANPAAGLPPSPGTSGTYYDPNSINDLGQWIRRSFSMVFTNLGPLTGFFVVQFVLGAVAYVLLDQGLRGAVITDNDFFGFNGSMLVAAAVVFVVGIVVSLAATLAVHYFLYGGHVGQQPSVGESMAVGFRRLPRFIGVSILLYLAFMLVVGVLVGLVGGLAVLIGEDASGLVVLLIVLLYIVYFVTVFWLSVKLAFIAVGSVVIPSGTSVIRTSWDASRGFFWPILGRQLLLSLIVGLIGMVVYFISYLGLIAVIFSQLEFDSDGQLRLDGQDVDTLDVLEVSSVLPNPVMMIAGFAVLSFLVYIIQSIIYSGTSALYADLGGPNIFGHRRR